MKKSELIERIKNLNDEDSVNEILKGTDIEDTFKTVPTLEMFKDLIQNNREFISFMDSEKDKHSAKAMATFKEKTMPTLINDAVLKATGKKKTPEELKYEELERQFNEEKAIRIKTENTNKLIGLLTDAGLDAKKTMEFFNVDNMENIDKSIGNFKAIIDEGIKAGVKEQISAGNYVPPAEAGDGIPSVEDIAKMMM